MRKTLAPVSLGSLGPFREVMLTHKDDKSRVSALLDYPFGERHNPYEEGLAHYLEHLAWANVRDAGDDKGNHSNALTSREATAYWLSRQPESLPDMLSRLAASASPLQVSREFAIQEKDIVQREYELRQLDDPMTAVWRESSKALYANGPYARSVLGTRSTIEQFSLDSAIRLHQQTHHLAEAKLLVSGPVSSSDLEQSISSIDNWPEQKVELLSAPSPLLPTHAEPDIAREQVSGISRPEVIPIAGCEDKNNRVISEVVSPAGHVFQLMPITEKGVTDITISAAWSTDWFAESGNNEWVPGLTTEMMLSSGTETLSPAEVLELLEDKNSRGNIFPSADYIYAEVEFPNNHQDAVLPVLAELFQKPQFDSRWFERIRQQTMDRIDIDTTAVGMQMWTASRYALFGDGPQRAFLNGTDNEALQNTTIESLEQWHQDTFSHRPAALVVTGAVNAEDAANMVDELLPAPGKPSLTDIKMQDMTFGSQTIFLHLPDAEKSSIGFVGPFPDTTDGQDGTDFVALHLFAGGAGGPLFEAIRTDLGASYGMGAQLVNYSRSQRALIISGEIESEKKWLRHERLYWKPMILF